MRHALLTLCRTVAVVLLAAGCAEEPVKPERRPSVAPSTQPTATLQLDAADITPMSRELLAVDLPIVTRVARAQNIDIQQARQRVEASAGRYESSVEALIPVIAPSFMWSHLSGPSQNANGTLVLTNFNNILPGITVQWIVNPGRAYYDIVAAKRRLESSGQQEQAVVLETARLSAVQYYDLVLAQAQVAVARKAATEAEEALRLTTLRVRAGNALGADEMRARAFLAGRRQDLLLAVNGFYQASLALTFTLHLDPLITLVPSPREIGQIMLVRGDLSAEQLLGMAVRYRPDLQSARTLLAAAEGDKGGTIWGALGPQLQAAYTIGALQTDVHGKTFHFHEQQRASAGAGWTLGLSTFGQIKVANANMRSAALDVERQLDQVRTQVISSQQSSRTNADLIPIAHEQVESAGEALRLAQLNLKAGQMLLLDVLQAEDEFDSARLRYANAVAHYNQSQINLLAALGLLNEEAEGVPATQPVTMTNP